jgi:small subunit ribosomal protein S17
MENKEEKPKKKGKKKNIALATATRGRIFQGLVTKKFEKRVVVEFKRTIYIQKYERYMKKNTKLHARIPENLDPQIGDLIKVQETRPLSKITHFIVTEITKPSTESKSKEVSTKIEEEKEK